MADQTVTLQVDGMDCDGCERSIHNALDQIGGVQESRASHQSGEVTVRFDDAKTDLDAIGRAIVDAGYEVRS
jgi:copper chaperone